MENVAIIIFRNQKTKRNIQDVQRQRLCRNAPHVFTFLYFCCPQVKSRTTARGRVAGGSSPVQMSWRDTSENTRDRSHMSACSATKPSAVLTTWRYTWRDMCEAKPKQNTKQMHPHIEVSPWGHFRGLERTCVQQVRCWTLFIHKAPLHKHRQLTCTYYTLKDKGDELVIFLFLIKS